MTRARAATTQVRSTTRHGLPLRTAVCLALLSFTGLGLFACSKGTEIKLEGATYVEDPASPGNITIQPHGTQGKKLDTLTFTSEIQKSEVDALRGATERPWNCSGCVCQGDKCNCAKCGKG